MASIQALLAVVARVLGRVLGTAFGWATVLLFGKVPEERQIYLSIASFGSVVWLITLLGIAFPSFATFMLAFVRVPEWIDRTWVRLAMLAIAVAIPLVVGFIALRMLHPSDRPPGALAQMRATLKGYPYTLGLALTCLMMIFVATVLQIRTLFKRWSTQHVPVLV
ncbi:MAG TPA: hypothetical protein VER55_02515, partial [Ardenticatenaceae bacterium]|nr:hypothetical protein [Ardenticatenaceae bacterium]